MRRYLAMGLFKLTLFALHRPSRSSELDELRSDAAKDFVYPPETQAWRIRQFGTEENVQKEHCEPPCSRLKRRRREVALSYV